MILDLGPKECEDYEEEEVEERERKKEDGTCTDTTSRVYNQVLSRSVSGSI